MLPVSPAGDVSSGDLKFRCLMCGRGYRSRSSLTRHSRYECGGLGSRYTFTCTLCGKYFCRPDHLKQHILNIHGGSVCKQKEIILSLKDSFFIRLLSLFFIINILIFFFSFFFLTISSKNFYYFSKFWTSEDHWVKEKRVDYFQKDRFTILYQINE